MLSGVEGRQLGPTSGSVRRISWCRASPVYCFVPSYADLKKLGIKLRLELASDVGRKGSSMKGKSIASEAGQRLRRVHRAELTRHTSTFYLLCTDVYQLLDLLRRNLFAGPCVLPPRLRLCDWCIAIVGVLSSLGGGSRALLGAEDILEERHRQSVCAGTCSEGARRRREGE